MILLAACAWISPADLAARQDPDGDGIPGAGAPGDADCAPFDATLPTTFYADVDGDGHGVPSASTQACEAPAGYAALADDCDDTRAAVHPGAAEVCDDADLDEDCDGKIDDADDDVDPSSLATFYGDADGDGSAGDTDVITACDAPTGYAAAATDCDDARADTHPGAAEVCDDGVDNDCDPATPPDCRRTGDVTTAEVAWSTSRVRGAGSTLAAVADLDGDTLADVAFGCDVSTDGLATVFLASAASPGTPVLGESSGTARVTGASDYEQTRTTVADATVWGTSPLLAIGVSPAGEVTDGPAVGRVYLVGLSRLASLDFSGTTAVFEGDDGDGAASFPPTVADLTGDDAPDLAVPTPTHTGSSGTSRGAVYLLPNPADGGLPPTMYAADTDPFVVGDTAGDQLGTGLTAGDLDGDGYADLIVAAPGRDDPADGAAGDDVGIVYLVSGPVDPSRTLTGLDRTADAHLGGEAEHDELGGEDAVDASVDLDGDGYLDLVVGAPTTQGSNPDNLSPYSTSPGRAYVLHGGPVLVSASVTAAATRLEGEHDEDRFGRAVRSLADHDGDGHPDLAIAASRADRVYTGVDGADDGDNAGKVYVVYGPLPAGTLAMPDAAGFVFTADDGDHAGQWLDAADVSGDGRTDLLVGGPGVAASAGGGWAFWGHGS